MNTEVSCPHCRIMKVVRNGIKKTGKQNLFCQSCSRQFQPSYEDSEAAPLLKAMLRRMLLRGSGIRDCAVVLVVRCGVVLRTIVKEGLPLQIKPLHQHYAKAQTDNQWSYLQNKDKKVWMIYAICAESGEILAASWGKRSSNTVRMLLLHRKPIQIDTWCSDDRASFKEVLLQGRHLTGNKHTKKIEGINAWG